MDDVQERLLAAFKDVARILDSRNIRYYAVFGTCIGAVRHDGFVPWDDDVDLAVWADDMPMVNELLTSGLDPSKYYYHVPSADTHPHVILKTGDSFKEELAGGRAPFIDIFQIDRYPDGPARRRLANLLIWGNTASIWALEHMSSIVAHRALCWMPRAFKLMADAVVESGSGSTVIYCSRFDRCVFPESWYGEGVPHRFEDVVIPLPCRYDGILTSVYGEYMKEPPADERHGASGFPCSAWKDWVMRRGDVRSSARSPAGRSSRGDAPPRSA